jgi:hypothetical protein
VTRRAKGLAVLGAVLMGGVLLVLRLGYLGGGVVQTSGTRAGDLDAGSVVGAEIPLRPDASEMIGLASVENVGHGPVLVESVEPQSTSPKLRATRGRIWLYPRNSHLSLPDSWDGWPPRHPPTRPPKSEPGWVQPHPDILALPTSREIPAGRDAQLVFGIFLHGDPSPRLRITGLRITFKDGDRTFVWTYPEPVSVLSWAQFNRSDGGGA